ncbi:MAG: glycosyltransferase, partial [Bacteroidia bacterium]|nr:glycosyltransferase [Bacteroidia bacterium]
MSKIRILRLITRLNVGGPAHHALILTKGLEAKGYETRLIAGQEPLGERRALPWIEKSSVAVEYLPMEREPSLSKDLRMVFHLWRIIRQWKPHIVHTHTAKAGAVGRVAAWLAGVPIRIHTYHGHSFEGYFSRRRSQLYRWIERSLGWITHRIIAISETQRRDLVEKFRIAPARKVSVIQLGFPLERLQEYDVQKVQQLRQEWGGEKGVYLIGWIGRMVPIKRIDRLLETLAALRPYAPPFQLIMIGDGPEYNRMRRLSERLKMDS